MIVKQYIFKVIIILFVTYFIAPMHIANAKTTIKGEIIAGGIIVVNSFPGAKVKLDGILVPVSDAGLFLVGFKRIPKIIQILEIYKGSKLVETISLNVKKRTYNVQKINGIEKDKVTPPQSVTNRIYAERKKVKESRKKANLIISTYYNNGFVLPAVGPQSGEYGSQRVLNGKARSPHYGIDIALPKGHEVLSPMDGIILFIDNDLYYSGGTIIIGHGQGLTTSYLHLSKILVSESDFVKKGQLIGEVGATGRATGPHLHWGVELKGKRLDPKYLKVFN
jgi:murein DD-endopeptidase MepM/ murein hydrolase activator NlpD